MGKGNHHRKLPAKQPVTRLPQPPPADGGSGRGRGSCGVWLQLPAILALSCVLGFTFNAANPLGVRFGELSTARSVDPAPDKAPAGEATTPPELAVLVATPPSRPVVAEPIEPPVIDALANPVVIAAPPATADPPQVVAITNVVTVTAPPLQAPATPLNPAPVHWPEVKSLVAQGHAVLVDVRHKAMYDAGHIPGAISLPESSSPEELTAFLNSQPANVMIVVYCSSTSCSQSARVANRLVTEFQRPLVRYMTGGYQEYQQAELANPAPAPSR